MHRAKVYAVYTLYDIAADIGIHMYADIGRATKEARHSIECLAVLSGNL